MNDIPEIKGYKRVIGLILAAVLAFFTVLVEHVRRSGAFMFNTPAELAATALQAVLYIVFFILGWKSQAPQRKRLWRMRSRILQLMYLPSGAVICLRAGTSAV